MLTTTPKPKTPAVSLLIPVKTVSGMNAREHWRVRAKRVKLERSATHWRLVACKASAPALPCTVKLTRLAPSSGLDSDNLQSSQKGIRDEIAKWLGIDDKSPLVTWEYAQRRATSYGVEVEIF